MAEMFTPQSGSAQNMLTAGGRNIPLFSQAAGVHNLVSTPEWMIKIDELLGSTIQDYDQFAELYGWASEEARVTKGSTANNLFATSALLQSPVTIVLPVSEYAATLDLKMYSGSNIEEITIVRLGNVGEERQIMQQIKYSNCKIEGISQIGDMYVVSFRPLTRENTVNKYDQTGGNVGQAVSAVDYSTGATPAA